MPFNDVGQKMVGTTDTAMIDKMIFDYHDDLTTKSATSQLRNVCLVICSNRKFLTSSIIMNKLQKIAAGLSHCYFL